MNSTDLFIMAFAGGYLAAFVITHALRRFARRLDALRR